MTLTPQEIEEIEGRAKAATAGPWHLCGTPENPCPVVNADGPDGYQVHSMLHVKDMYPNDRPGFGTWDLMKDAYCKDAAFIAHAREDVPALIEHIRALERDHAAALDRAREEMRERCARILETKVVSGPDDEEIDHDDYRDCRFAELIRAVPLTETGS